MYKQCENRFNQLHFIFIVNGWTAAEFGHGVLLEECLEVIKLPILLYGLK